MKKVYSIGIALILISMMNQIQAARASVSADEVNGTFLMNFSGKFKDFTNKLTIKSQGSGTLKVDFELVYPYDVNNEPMANTGVLSGEATITGDTATYQSDEFGHCKIVMVFTKPGVVKVSQEGTDADCGFGHNVYADGTYNKTNKN